MIFVGSMKICRRSSSLIKIVTIVTVKRMTGARPEDLCTFVRISRCILLRMRNVLEKIVEKIKNTHFYVE